MIMRCVLIPSLICFDYLRLGEQLDVLQKYGVNNIHIDVMDGNFVKQITVGEEFVKQIRKELKNFFICVHLMVESPLSKIDTFIEAGADCIAFHTEACKNINEIAECCEKIRNRGAKCCIVLNPEIDVEIIGKILDKTAVDKILVMSVKAGASGQKFIENSVVKIQKLKAVLKTLPNANEVEISVDGGINLEVLPRLLDEGINGVIVGSALHKAHGNEEDRIINFQTNVKDFLAILKR